MAGYIGSKASVVSSGAERKKTFAITTSTTALTGLVYTPTKVHVFHNGVRLVDGTDFTATNGTSITLTVAAESGDQVVVVSYASFQVADAYTQTEADAEFVAKAGDTMTGPLNVTGTVTADGLTVDGGATSEIKVFSNGRVNPTTLSEGSSGAELMVGSANSLTLGTASSDRLNIGSNGDISFYEDTGTTPKFFWDASAESLGIGTTSPVISNGGEKLIVYTPSGGTGLSEETRFQIGQGGSTQSQVANIVAGTISGGTPYLAFEARGSSGGVPLERMRIDSSGDVLIGKTSTSSTVQGMHIGTAKFTATRNAGPCAAFVRTGSDGSVVDIQNDGSTVGSISVSGSSTAYNTSSDYRLKTDAQPMTGASARVQALNPVNFEWIVDGTRTDGFLAHEAQAVVPESVTGTKDAMMDEEYEVTAAVYEDVVIEAVLDDEGNELEAERTEQNLVTEAVMGTRNVPDYQGIDQSKLVPLLTAALQEALNKIDTMETRLAALEGN